MPRIEGSEDIPKLKTSGRKKKPIIYNASIFLVIVMHSSRNSSSRPLYSVVNSVVHTMIHSTVCMKLVGIFLYSLLGPF